MCLLGQAAGGSTCMPHAGCLQGALQVIMGGAKLLQEPTTRMHIAAG